MENDLSGDRVSYIADANPSTINIQIWQEWNKKPSGWTGIQGLRGADWAEYSYK